MHPLFMPKRRGVSEQSGTQTVNRFKGLIPVISKDWQYESINYRKSQYGINPFWRPAEYRLHPMGQHGSRTKQTPKLSDFQVWRRYKEDADEL